MLQKVAPNTNRQNYLYKIKKTFRYYLAVQIKNNHPIDLWQTQTHFIIIYVLKYVKFLI